MAWIIGGILAVVAFASIAYILSVKFGRKRPAGNEGRPGYQSVIVKNAVDVKSQRYVSSVGQHFPNVGGVQSAPTVLTEDNLGMRYLVLYDTATGNQYNCGFTKRLIIGRDPAAREGDSRFILNDALVSKSHCKVEASGQLLIISDMGSKNGTFVNGKSIENVSPLNSGDRLNIGGSAFIVRI